MTYETFGINPEGINSLVGTGAVSNHRRCGRSGPLADCATTALKDEKENYQASGAISGRMIFRRFVAFRSSTIRKKAFIN
ncbi:hypothetical protein RB195_000820 [Necator americanus]|uniref:Uncharacterized protein n=1 Tax=Necator americanus TaxID=51031 RepID=A0ABR1DCU7_NECAM